MPITVTNGSELIGATEHSLPRDAAYASGSPQTTDCFIGVTLNVSDLALGDEIQVKVYETLNSEQLPIYVTNIVGPQSTAHFVVPDVSVGSGWDVTLKWISGTERTIYWRLKVTTGDTTAAIAAAVMASVVDTGFDVTRTLRNIAASTAGKNTGNTFRNQSDTTDQVAATVDASGNRTAITYGA